MAMPPTTTAYLIPAVVGSAVTADFSPAATFGYYFIIAVLLVLSVPCILHSSSHIIRRGTSIVIAPVLPSIILLRPRTYARGGIATDGASGSIGMSAE